MEDEEERLEKKLGDGTCSRKRPSDQLRANNIQCRAGSRDRAVGRGMIKKRRDKRLTTWR
jgi:hypothetical protein